MNPKFYPITRPLCEFVKHIRAWAFNLMETSSVSKSWSLEDVLSPHDTSNLYGLHNGVVWSIVLVLDQYPEQSDRLSYPRLDLCLVKSFLVFPNGLWFWAKFLFVCHLKLPSVLPPFWHVLLFSPITTTRKIIGRSSRSLKWRVVMCPSSLLLL